MQYSKVTKWGNSIALRLPSALLYSAGLIDGSDVLLRSEGNRIIIQKVSDKQLSLAALIAKITPENQHVDAWLAVEPIGDEVW